MSRDARINPIEGDVLAIGISQWEVMEAGTTRVIIMRERSISSLDIGSFRSFFKLASTVRYGDEQ